MLLMLQIFAFNSMTSCVSYYYYLQTKSVFDLPLSVDVGMGVRTSTSSASALASVRGKMNVEEYLKGKIVETRGMRWNMYASSISASIVLGVVSFIAAQYDY